MAPRAKTFLDPKKRSVKLEEETWEEIDQLFFEMRRTRSTKEHFYEELMLLGLQQIKASRQLPLFE